MAGFSHALAVPNTARRENRSPVHGEMRPLLRGRRLRFAACGNELFRFQTKYDSGLGWPSFYEVVDTSRILEKEDRSLFMVRHGNFMRQLWLPLRARLPRWS